MRYLFLVTRILTGALFVFSGLVKLNDPSGFAIKLNEYFDVFAEDLSVEQDSISLEIKTETQLIFSEKFQIYPSDDQKEISIKINGDTLSNLQSQVRWGGIERSSEIHGVDVFPKKIQAQIYLISTAKKPNVKVETKTLNFDSLQQVSREALTSYVVDLRSFIKPSGYGTRFFQWIKSYSLYLSVFFCGLEVWLGIALLIGYRIRFTVWVTASLIVFFTFLTWYSAAFNKVTDCGCFGDFIKLKPWDSFKKDVILTFMVLILITGMKHHVSWLDKKVERLWMSIAAIMTLCFGIYCYRYLPIWDFLPYKKGNDILYIMNHIPSGERASDSIQVRFVMQKGNDSIKVSTLDYAQAIENGYSFVRQDRKIIVEGYKSPIHDFAIYNLQTGEDLKATILEDTGMKFLLVMPFLSETYTSCLTEIVEIHRWCAQKGIPFYGLSSASLEPAIAFAKSNKLEFPIYAADQKMLMTMARYNPTLFVLKGSVIIEKRSGRNLPSIVELSQNLENN